MNILPPLVAQLTTVAEAWIVGSAADPKTDLIAVRDFDLVVPFSKWYIAASLLPKDANPNLFGGWECKSSGYPIDIWPDEINRLMISNYTGYLWQPFYGVRYKKI